MAAARRCLPALCAGERCAGVHPGDFVLRHLIFCGRFWGFDGAETPAPACAWERYPRFLRLLFFFFGVYG